MNKPGTNVGPVRSAVRIGVLVAILLLLPGASRSGAAELKEDGLRAWNVYVQTVNATMAARAEGKNPFLWVDESPELGRRVRAGEVLVATHGVRTVPGGLIHHWVGAMFLPGVTPDEVTQVLDDYDHYGEFYRPMVMKSKLLERTDDHDLVTMLMMRKAFSVTAAVETDNQVRRIQLDADKVYTLSSSVRVQEVANYGRRDEHLFSEGQGPGYVWRTFEMTRVDQRDGGVYLEMEMISLSRGIPVAFRWLITPLTEKLPRQIVFDMLSDTAAAVRRETESNSDKNQNIAQNSAPEANRPEANRPEANQVAWLGDGSSRKTTRRSQ